MILVTGCTGYIGSRLCKKLLEAEYQVCGLIKPSEREKARSLIDLDLLPYFGDLTDSLSLHQLSKDIHFVFHLAGIHSTFNNTYNLYVQGTINLIQSLPKGQMIPIVVASNSSVYENAGEVHSEDIKLNPKNPFGAITIKMEKIIEKYCSQYSIMRIGEVYGDHEADPFLGLKKSVVLIGNGTNYASKIHIEDLLNILVKCIDKFPKGIFNICDDEPVQQVEFYRYVEELSKTRLINLRQDIELEERIMLSIHGLRTLNISMKNKKIKDRLNYTFIFPTYKDGLKHLYEHSDGFTIGLVL